MRKYQVGDILICRANLVEPLPLLPDRLYVLNTEVHSDGKNSDVTYFCRVSSGSGRAGSCTHFDEAEVAPFSEYVVLRDTKMKKETGRMLDEMVATAAVEIKDIEAKE